MSQAGNHDNRVYEDDWAEKWQGLLEKNADGTTNYDNQANQLVAHQLKGKLLLAHGSMDANVPFYSTLLVVDALIKANKDFDLIIFPNRGHGFGSEPYMVRRRWDYFVRHLLGVEPPPYEMKGAPAPTTPRSRARVCRAPTGDRLPAAIAEDPRVAADRFVLDADRVVLVFLPNQMQELAGIERLRLLEHLHREA